MCQARRDRRNRPTARHWLWTEAVAWTVGLAAVSLWAAISGMGRVGAEQGLREFADVRAAAELSIRQAPDQQFWSPERKPAWVAAVQREVPAPLAVLRIPRIALEVAVRSLAWCWACASRKAHASGSMRS